MKQLFRLLSVILVLCLLKSSMTTEVESGKIFDYIKTGGFRCVGDTGIETALRVNLNNEVECYSINGKECIWGLSSNEKCLELLTKKSGALIPLECGVMHQKLYGMNGYDNKGHWCNKALQHFFGKVHCPSKTGLKVALIMDRKTGEVQCLSRDFKTCYQEKDLDSVCENTNKCKVAGKAKRRILAETLNPKPAFGILGCETAVKEQLGYPGYQHPQRHWCRDGMTYFRYNGNWLLHSQTKMDQIFRLNKQGQIECLSKDGTNCLISKGGDSDMIKKINSMTDNGKKENPKVKKCGEGLAKGLTGYEKKDGFCHNAYFAVLGKHKPQPTPKNKPNKPKPTPKKPNQVNKPSAKNPKKPNPSKAKTDKKDKPSPPKKDPKINFPWRHVIFGPQHNGFDQDKKAVLKTWRNKKADPANGGKKPTAKPGNKPAAKGKKTPPKIPGWRSEGNKKLGFTPPVPPPPGIGETWRQIKFTKKALAEDKKKREKAANPNKPSAPKDNWRNNNGMYNPASKKKTPAKKPISKPKSKYGYSGKWIPLMNQLRFFSKKGTPLGGGSQIKITHILTKNHLHSHGVNYNTGSKQQEVTGFSGADNNDWWIIKGPKVISHGTIVQLTHKSTGKNLHSHRIVSPSSHQQEVSGYGFNGRGDSNDNWRFLMIKSYIEGNNTWKVGDIFNLVHVNTGKYLHSHNIRTKVTRQFEVTGYGGVDMNNHWTVSEKFGSK